MSAAARVLAGVALVAAMAVAWADSANPFFNDLGFLVIVGALAIAVVRDRAARLAWIAGSALWAVT